MSDLDPFREGGPLEAAYFLFQQQGLPLPPIPEPLLSRIEQYGENNFSSHPTVPALIGLERLIDETARGEGAPLVAFGFEGRGMHSWWFRYALIVPERAVFIELPLAGPYRDAESTNAAIREAIEATGVLMAIPAGGGRYVVDQRSGSGRYCEIGGEWVADRAPILAVTRLLSH